MNRLIQDILRILILLVVVGCFLLYADPANSVVVQSLAIAIFVAGGTHLTRRILFHRIDLQTIALKAVQENNAAAAVVFAAVIAFLIALMYLSLRVLS